MNGLDANDATNAFVKVKDIMFEPIELLFDCNKGTCDSCTCCHDRFVSEVRLVRSTEEKQKPERYMTKTFTYDVIILFRFRSKI